MYTCVCVCVCGAHFFETLMAPCCWKKKVVLHCVFGIEGLAAVSHSCTIHTNALCETCACFLSTALRCASLSACVHNAPHHIFGRERICLAQHVSCLVQLLNLASQCSVARCNACKMIRCEREFCMHL